MAEPTTLDDDKVTPTLVGRTITRAWSYDSSPDRDWTGHEEVMLWLDDGRVIKFGAWGHDAWGVTITEVRVVDVPSCLHCGQEHKDREVCDGWEWSDTLGLPRTPFAWCTDGRHAAWIEPTEG